MILFVLHTDEVSLTGRTNGNVVSSIQWRRRSQMEWKSIFNPAPSNNAKLTLFGRIGRRCADGDCFRREEVGLRWEDRMSEVTMRRGSTRMRTRMRQSRREVEVAVEN